MPFKTPGKTSEYIRELLSLRAADEVERKITDYADKNIIAVSAPDFN